MSVKKNNVLIIDDDIGLMQAMEIVLENYGIGLSKYTEPIAAIQELKTNKHDVLVVNYLMPMIRGDEIVKLVREFDKEIYIILMSAHKDLAPSIDIMRSLDIQAFFEKGARFDDLILLIESGYKYVEQMNEIKQMSMTINNFGVEIATVLKNAVDAKDNYTKEHSDRVAIYADKFAEYLNLSNDDRKTLSLAANFHDIGKIGIADAILLKNGKLTDEEYETIKLHPVIGETILSSSETFKDALPLVRHHHERIDGRGYPDKLKGDEIPYLVKLISICDTFDALTSRRVYRDGYTLDDALAEIKRSAGTQLDTDLSDKFINFVKQEIDFVTNTIPNNK